jgi:hypothetical protein
MVSNKKEKKTKVSVSFSAKEERHMLTRVPELNLGYKF